GRADESPEGASRTREGVGRGEGDRREPAGRARRGWGGVRLRSRERPEGASGSTEVAARAASEASEQDRLPVVLCGVGLKGAVAGGEAAGCPWRVAPRCREDEARRSKHRSEGVSNASD
ncbi:hypothetical protein ACOJIV_27875, partial [Haloarcula sp. AONF1]